MLTKSDYNTDFEFTNGYYFILGELSRNIMDNRLSSSFITHLLELENDELIEYDLRDIVSGKHLHHKTHEFGKKSYNTVGLMTPPRYYAPNDPDDSDSDAGITPRFCVPDLYDLRSNESNISLFNYNIPSPMNQSLYGLRSKSLLSLHSESLSPTITINNNNNIKYKPIYDNDIKCMKYESIDDDENIINRNTAFIHDIIDPNKNINDHRLWIPSIFNCTQPCHSMIKSQIVGLDLVKYSVLYKDIVNIFKNMQFMFENVLNRKLSTNERVIIRCTKCVLQKYGDETADIMCCDGMGENIECIGLYLAAIHNRNCITLKLSLNDCNTEINLFNGDCIVFSNECYHCIERIVHNKYDCNQEAIYYTMLTFYLINENQVNIADSNDNSLYVNLVYNWSYIIAFWLRLHRINGISNSWMNGLIYLYLFGKDYDEYIYDRRQTMIYEKQRAIIKPQNESFNIANHLDDILNEININQ